MTYFLKLGVVPIFFLSLIAGMAGTPERETVLERSPVKPTQPWQITVGNPVLLTGFRGYSASNGADPYVNVEVGQFLSPINVANPTAAEIRGGRFGVLGDLLCANAQAGANATDLVTGAGVELQEFFGEFFGSCRLIRGLRVDLLAGFGSTYPGQQTGINANVQAIDAASTELVAQFAQQLTTPDFGLRTLVQRNIVHRPTSLIGRRPALPVGRIAGPEVGQIRDFVQQLIQSREPELPAAIRVGIQVRVDHLEAQPVNQAASCSTGSLNQSFSF